MRKEIKTAGGEGGMPFIELIYDILKKDGEILTGQNTTQSDLLNLSKLFFEHSDSISLEKLRNNFCCVATGLCWRTPESSIKLSGQVCKRAYGASIAWALKKT